jgi:putative hydrolase of the HAD superfamily
MTTKVKAVVFGIDDVLYDATYQTTNARLSAVRAMIEAGLPVDVETGYRILEDIVKELGPDNTKHFDKLLEKLGLKWNPAVIAAGVVAYRETYPVYLKLYPDTMPTLLRLRESGFKVGCASGGKSVKQWQKLVSLGLEQCFHSVVISEDLDLQTFSKEVLDHAVRSLGVGSSEAVYIGTNPKTDLLIADEAHVLAVRLRKGDSRSEKIVGAKPLHEIEKLSEIFRSVLQL